ncbi:MAG: putative glycoside hydrolase, partial [Candidatus Methylomirabilia bacterium]
VWEYVIAVAREAALKGFDEIQFDYLRFPTDGNLSAVRYSEPNTQAMRLQAISTFLARARQELGPLGVFLAADLFGYIAYNENDTQIGQRVEDLARYLDYLCPMVYPSSFHRGIPGYRNPVENPYEVVRATIELMAKRARPVPVQIRPWLQDFRDYAFDRRYFGTEEVRAQMKGAEDGGSQGWMLWNPRNRYTAGALRAVASLTERETWSAP